MQHADQHLEAIRPSVSITEKVEASVFSDKVTEMGRVTVEGGRITIDLDYVPGMVSHDATRDQLVDAIALALKVCFQAMPQAFDRHHTPSHSQRLDAFEV